MSFICPLLAPLRRFLPLPYTYPNYTAKLLLSSFMPFQVRLSIFTLLSSTGYVLLSIFLPLYHPPNSSYHPFYPASPFTRGGVSSLSVPQLLPQVRPSDLSSESSSVTDFFFFWIFMREIEPQVELESTLVYDPHLWYFIHGVGFLRTPSIPTMHTLHYPYNKEFA